MKVFSEEKLIYKFMGEEFDAIPPKQLIAYVDDIYTKEDKIILERWKKHFTDLKHPFAITKAETTTFHGRVYRLWKQKLT